MKSDPALQPSLDAIPDPLGAAGVRSRIPGPPAFEPAVSRSAVRRRHWLALALSLAWLGLHLLVYGVRADFSALPWSTVAAEIVLPFVLALSSLVIALHPGRSGLGLGIGVLAAVTLVVPLLFGLAVSLGVPSRASTAADRTWVGAAVCFDLTVVWAAVPLLLAAMALRRAFPVAVPWRSALLGVAAGLLAGAVMNLHCANVDRLHMTLGHVVPALIATLVAGLLVSRSARI